ncbi:MAG: helix-turn-helix domain-containing protein [Spirochaetaceae bacterium]|jgi:transcriptional regulator with XRE-family HTH domain|nr:helix-turn-helix domain-containing protein [Spirochaetaceae bacterium]
MSDFAERLRETIEYTGLLQKEVAAKAGIKKRALDMYLGSQKSMPPADIAVQLASVLGVTVEYLVTGKMTMQSADVAQYLKFRDIIEDLPYIPGEILNPVKRMLKAIAERERGKEKYRGKN